MGRDYHSEALLLPDGRVITLGSDPLYADAQNTNPGTFEKRIEIYSPPYLFQGDRPEIASGPVQIDRGSTELVRHPGRGGGPIRAAGAPERGHPRDGRGAAIDQARLRVETGTGSM